MALSPEGTETPFLQRGADGTLFHVHVVPAAARTEIVGMHGDRLKIKLHSPAHDGAANRELVRFVATALAIKSAQVELVRGASSRRKSLLIPTSVAVAERAKALVNP